MKEHLSERERQILRYIIESFIKYGTPVGSRFVSKSTGLNLSSATIRNVMSDLEDLNLLKTPHTSAGRMPTDRGYRYYVDELMNKENLNKSEAEFLKSKLEGSKLKVYDDDDFFSITSQILGKISHQLAVVTQPFLSLGVFEKLEAISLSSTRILIVISVKSGYVRTLLLEIDTEIPTQKIERLTHYLNERLSGLTLTEIRDTFMERLNDYNDEPELLQLFINSIDKIFSEDEKGNKVYVSGTAEIIMQPEFDDPKNFKDVVSLAENKDLVIHIVQATGKNTEDVSITIGSENPERKLKDYSLICADYSFGSIKGKIGIIGPKRINYGKMVSLVEYTSKLISELKS